MQATLKVYCLCGKYLGDVQVDTANDDDTLSWKVKKVILSHRKSCKFYRSEQCANLI